MKKILVLAFVFVDDQIWIPSKIILTILSFFHIELLFHNFYGKISSDNKIFTIFTYNMLLHQFLSLPADLKHFTEIHSVNIKKQ